MNLLTASEWDGVFSDQKVFVANVLAKNGHFYHDQTSRPRATKPTRATRRTRVWWLDQPGLLSQISDYINA